MRRLLLVLLAALPLAANGPLPAPPRELTLDLVFAEGAGGRQPSDLAWSPDGTRLAYLWDDGAGEALWVLDAATGRAEPVLRREEIDELVWSPAGDAIALLAEGDLSLLTLRDRALARLTTTPEKEEAPAFSPDGGSLAFVRGFDLHLLDLATRRERALTTDGEENQVLNGTTDWLYWEEIWNREATGFWWAPDGRRIAYYRFEEGEVPRYPLVDELPRYPEVRWQRYPTAGETNPRVKVGVLDLASGRTTWLATGGAPDDYLARVHWAPNGGRVAVEHLDRGQTRVTILLCGAADGRCAPLHVEELPPWINLGKDFRFLSDGRFLRGAEREGYRRLYLHAADGRELRAVTPPGWAVASLDGLDAERGVVVATGFQTAGLGAAERQVLRASLERDEVDRLTPDAGWSTALVAPRTGSWVHTWSDANTPPRLALRRPDGGEAAVLPSAPPLFDPAAVSPWRLFTIPGPEGSRLPARSLEPAGFDARRRYPVLIYHYGGPGSQVVLNRWEGNVRGLWHRAMAQRGYAVLSVDNQASLFFGRAGEDRLHRRFGEVELAGQLAAVEYLKGLGWVDAARLGLWGWSGGGFNTLYSLFNRPGVWRAGVAGAPPTDWRLYDTAWTERYLDHPRDNEKGYEASSPVTYAAKLADHLLLVHGTGDDNVHPQNSTVLAQKLVEAGRPFEEAFYPNQKHGMTGAAQEHFYRRMTEFFDRHLKER